MVVSNVSGLSTEGLFALRIQYGTLGDANNKEEYIGIAPAGSLEGSAVWMIKKLSYSAIGVISVTFADGDALFNNVWTNPENRTYK